MFSSMLCPSTTGTVCIRKYYASQLLCFFEIWKTLGSVSKIRKYYVSQILCFSPYYCRGFLTAFPTTVEKCRTASSNFSQTRKCGFNKKLHRCGNEVCSVSIRRHPQLAPLWEPSSRRIPEVYQPSFRSKIQNLEHQKIKIRFMKFENLVSVRATGADKSAAGPPDLGFWRPGSRKSY